MEKTFWIYDNSGFIGEFKSPSGFAELSFSEKRCGNFIWAIRNPTRDTVAIWLAQKPYEIGVDEYGTIWLGKYRDAKRLWPEISPSAEIVLVSTELAEVIDGLDKVGAM